jgi:hypothetical protein
MKIAMITLRSGKKRQEERFWDIFALMSLKRSFMQQIFYPYGSWEAMSPRMLQSLTFLGCTALFAGIV